jgi:hypothetical protein
MQRCNLYLSYWHVTASNFQRFRVTCNLLDSETDKSAGLPRNDLNSFDVTPYDVNYYSLLGVYLCDNIHGVSLLHRVVGKKNKIYNGLFRSQFHAFC